MRDNRILILVVAAITFSVFATPVEAQYRYRWVDENGTTQISDRVPADAARFRVEVLNNRGMVVRVMEAAMNEEERAAAARRAEEEAAAEAAAEAQARRDNMLLQSYTSVSDLERARDGRLQALAAQIRVSRAAVENLQENVDTLQAQVDQRQQNQQPVPEDLTNRLATAREQLEANERFAVAREQEYAQIEASFTADIARYRELRGLD